MINAFRAEWARLAQTRLFIISAVLILVAAFGGSAIVLSSTKPAATTSPDSFVPALESLTSAGGGTDIFRFIVAFGGTMVFVVFVGLFSLEYSRGTYRTMLLRQPRRVALLAGKFTALIAFSALVILALEITTWLAALIESPSFDVSTSAWTSPHTLVAAIGDFLMAMLWLTGYAAFGMTIAIVVRSAAPALGVAVVWAGPFEHLVDNAWSGAREYFPGLLLEAVGSGGAGNVSATRAAVSAGIYITLFALVTATVFSRRDVTS